MTETATAPRTTALTRAANAIRDADSVSLLCRVSLVLLLIDGREDARTLIAAAVVVVVAFYRPAIYRSAALWLSIGVPLLAMQLWRWEGLDDHIVLTTYWFCALGLALLTDDPARAMRTSGRLLLGFTFTCATLWKLSSSEYLSSRMFHDLLLDDSRFRLLAHWLGGISDDHLRANTALVAGLNDPATTDLAPKLFGSARLHFVAVVMTWWTLAIEAALAIAWVGGDRITRAHVRIALLLVFCLTTYIALPVTAFAGILLTLALATTAVGDRSRVLLVGAFSVLALYTPIWTAIAHP